jgi:hypothetical protein
MCRDMTKLTGDLALAWRGLSADPKLRTLSNEDPLGHQLMQTRIDALPQLLQAYIEQPTAFSVFSAGDIQISGIGTSQAHSEFLSYLLEKYIQRSSKVIDPLEIMQDASEQVKKIRDNLVVFSQGLSPNTHAAIAALSNARKGFLFTSTSQEDESPESEKSKLLEQITKSGVETVLFPIANEYELLPRFIGPLLGFAACYKFVKEGLLNEQENELRKLDLDQFFSSASNFAKSIHAQLSEVDFDNAPIHLVATVPFHWTALNLQEKIRECLLPAGGVCLSNITGYDHGRFQHNRAHNGVEFILTRVDRTGVEEKLVHNRDNQSKHAGLTTVTVESPYSRDLSIMWFEMVFNYLMLDLVQERQMNLVEWPGKELEALGNYRLTGL